MARSKLQLTPRSEATAKLDLKPGTDTVAVADIRLRKDADTRPLAASHVVQLAESITVLGLLEPVVLDTAGNLLAGGHRLAALQLLAEGPAARRAGFLTRCGCIAAEKSNPELASLADRLAMLGEAPLPSVEVAVQVVDVTGQGNSDLALAVEAAENNIRRQYTRDEIKGLAKRFEAAGYKTSPGKPKLGEKTVLNALEAAVGKSKRQIQNILSNKPTAEDRTDWARAVRAFQRAAQRVLNHGEGRTSEKAKALIDAARRAAKA
jgi:ParB family chromosome partitioning protein